jgi:hypothetical protein
MGMHECIMTWLRYPGVAPIASPGHIGPWEGSGVQDNEKGRHLLTKGSLTQNRHSNSTN